MIILANFFTDFFSGADSERVVDFLIRLFFSSATIFILIRYIYYPNNGQYEFLFTLFLTGLIVFLIASILDRVKMEFGFAMGLFAIFSIIRFRTVNIELKEMAYLFTTVGISVINALVNYQIEDWRGLLISNFIILLAAFSMEKYQPRKKVAKKLLTLTLTDLQILNDNKLLLEEVRKQTNLNVFKVDVSKINASKKEVVAWIYYK